MLRREAVRPKPRLIAVTSHRRPPSHSLFSAIFLSVALNPEVTLSPTVAGIVPLPEGVAHGAYIAAVAFSWGLLSVAIIGALTTLGRRTGRAVSLGDVAWALASLATLAAWIFAGYAWNVAKFGKVELDAVGPTTLWWPVTVIVATVFLFAARHVQRAVGTAAWAVVGVCVAILLVDITLSTVGAIRDGSVSELGLVVGGLALLQVAMFVGRIFAIRRSRSASTS